MLLFIENRCFLIFTVVNTNIKGYLFQNFNVVFFLIITTLLSWLKSTLLLKNKCFGTTIYMKTQCLQTNETQHCLGKESALGVGGGVERVALIKSLIYMR